MLVRVVRLTIETNALTGTSLGEPHTGVHLTSPFFSLAASAITSLVLYFAFPVSRTELCYDPSSDQITLFTE